MKRTPIHARSRARLLAAGCLMAATARLEAAVLIEETFTVTAGWNLIRVSVEPLVKDPVQALEGIEWDSLWTWVPGALQRGGRWVGLRRDDPAFLGSLSVLAGPASYALNARAAGTLRLRGILRGERPSLRAGYQLFGPGVPAAAPPTLGTYFSRPGVRERLEAVYEHAGGSYRRVVDADPLRPGAAYWVLARQDVPAPEPLRLKAGLGGMRFDSQTTLSEVEIDLGAAPEARQVTVSAVPSADGASTIDWLELRSPGGDFEPPGGGGGPGGGGAGAVIVVPAGETGVSLAFRARWRGVGQAGTTDQAGVVEIASRAGRVRVGAELNVPTLRGFWMGEASLSEVKAPSALGGAFAAAPGFDFSVILEFPDAGPPRLLPCVQLETDRDGRKLLHRIEAALFHSPQVLTGTIGPDGESGVLTGNVLLDGDHPLNPYRHRYHPEHQSGYPVARILRLDFDPPGHPDSSATLATVGNLEGTYQEEIRGLTREPVLARGTFSLRRLTDSTVTACSAAQP